MTRALRRAIPLVPAIVIAVGGWAHRWINEDAYINLRIVDQIFAGHGPVFNAGERVEAGTSPLWLAVLVVGRGLFGWFAADEWIAVLAALLAAVAAFAMAGVAAHRLHRSDGGHRDGVAVPVGVLLVAAVAVVWDFSTSGLETGLTWLWLAGAWLAVVTAARADTVSGRTRTVACVTIGLAPLVRPDLGLVMVALIAAWFALARPRRIGLDLVAMFALPVAYQLFRMGYYANLFPNTALARDASGLHVGQGWEYARDFIDAYWLWVTLAFFAAAVVGRSLRSRDRRVAIATAAMVGGGLLHATYIVVVGGDYMHGRLLLPAFFALGLPASVSIGRKRLPELALGAAAVAWAAVSIVAFRPPPPPQGYVVAPVSDWREVSGATVFLEVDGDPIYGGRQAKAAYDRGVRGYFRVLSPERLPARDPDAYILTLGSIGAPAYLAGRQIRVIDIGGLAEPLAARTSIVPGRPAGHRKQVDPAWYDARFGDPEALDGPAVDAARRALSCGPGKELLDAVSGDLTPGRFLSNIWRSVGLTRLHVPADPVVAERRWCDRS